jgi:cytosine/uracil/thiamine/allantoin permease
MMPAMTPPTPPAANTIPPAAHDVEAALPGMVRWTRAAAVGSLLGLIVLGLAWELVLAPTGNRTLVIKVLPLPQKMQQKRRHHLESERMAH